MLEQSVPRPSLDPSRKAVFQGVALTMCVLLGLAMILNTQLGGEAMWFWYTTLFHGGAKLYSELHTPLQPLFVLETDAWMKLLGHKAIETEIPSVVHLLALCLGLFLVLRESTWPDWQKAIVLVAAFTLFATGHSYRFDDYHVVAECFILYSLLGLLLLARAESSMVQMRWAAGLGVLSGLTIVTRLTDGAALLAVVGLSLLFLVRKNKLLALGLFIVAAAIAGFVIISMTGDSFSDYVSNTIIKAAGSKGGTGSIFAAPFLVVRNTLELASRRKQPIAFMAIIFGIGALLKRYVTSRFGYIVLIQLAFTAVVYALCPYATRQKLKLGFFIGIMVLVLILVTYLLAPIVTARFLLSRTSSTHREWDPREVLVLLSLAIWASYSAGAGAEPLTQYYAPFGMLLLLAAVLQPFRKYAAWAYPSFITILVVLGLSGFVSKVLLPYYWQNYRYSTMFENREWYHHPVYGTMYIDSDLLRFSESVCSDIGAVNGAKPDLLALPYPFPNYFCATPPWHGYVQTFFDTSTRATIDKMMRELEAAPPQYIVYQRQLGGLYGSEQLYNHGKPWPQRDLDTMIMRKIANGQWQLVEKKNYLEGDGWFIVKTHN